MQNCLAGKECALAKPDVRAEPIEPELGPMLAAEGTIVAVVVVVVVLAKTYIGRRVQRISTSFQFDGRRRR